MKNVEIVKHYNKTVTGNILFKTEYYQYTPHKGWIEVDLSSKTITEDSYSVVDIVHDGFYYKRKSGNIGRTHIKQVWDNPNIEKGERS